MAKARQAMVSAEALLKLPDPDGACNRAYYAMFDAARAALLMKGIEDTGKSHSGTLTLFSLHLIRDGPLDPSLSSAIKRAQDLRLFADYLGDPVELDTATEVVTQATIFVTRVFEAFE